MTNLSTLGDRASVVWGSVTDQEIVEKTVREQDVVVHMAARISVDESISTPASFLSVNVMGTFNVLEALRKYGGRLLYASSCEVYGTSQEKAVSETAELRPHSPYAASKTAADRLCFAYCKTYELDITIARPCNIYGSRQKGRRGGAVIPIFVDRALAQQPLVVYGTGEQSREYMHVDDLVAAYNLVIEKTGLQGEAINFGTGETPSIKEIAEFIAHRLDASIEYGPSRPGEVKEFRLDCTKARQLGFVPRVLFWEGLEQYIQWRKTSKSM
jgi:dTDP-glucose 4,6-dehydratase